MKIAVCIKQVPNTTNVRIDSATGTLIRDNVTSIMNPDDKAGLEEALKLKEQFNSEVIVLTMGPSQADLVLREALAMGADKAILLSDRKFAGADTLATSYTLAAALKLIQADLVITGRQSIDGDTSQVGPQIAEFLDLPQVTFVQEISSQDGKTFVLKRSIENGYQKINVSTPCLFTVQSTANTPRYMTVGGILDVYNQEIETWDANKLQVSEDKIGLAGSPTKVVESYAPETNKVTEILTLSPNEAVSKITSILKEKHII